MKEKIIEILSKEDNTSLTAFEINDLLGLKTTSEFSELIGVLDEMCEDAILYHSNKDKYLLFENSHLIKGKLQLKEKGFGFIVGTNLAHDIHVSKENINGALNDDIVAVEMLDKNLYEGRIVRILKRDDKTIVGEVVVENGNYYVIPDKKSIPRLGVVKGHTIGAVEGHKVAVKRTSAS